MSAFRMTHPTADSIDADVEFEKAFGRLRDYLDVPEQFIKFSPEELLGTVTMIGASPVRLAARLESQTEEERWSHVWDKVGGYLWSVLPPPEELSGQIETLSRE